MGKASKLGACSALLFLLAGCGGGALHMDAGKRMESGGDFGGAAEEYKKAVQEQPKSGEANLGLARCLRKINDNKGAEEAFKNAIDGDGGNHIEAHVGLANILMENGDLNGAKDEFNTASTLDAQNAAAIYGMGQVMEKQGDLAGAMDKYRAALKIEPDNADMHKSLGQVLGQSNKFDEAKREMELAGKLQRGEIKPDGKAK